MERSEPDGVRIILAPAVCDFQRSNAKAEKPPVCRQWLKFSFDDVPEDGGEQGVQFGGGLGWQAAHCIHRLILKKRPMQMKLLPKSIRPQQDGSGTVSKI